MFALIIVAGCFKTFSGFPGGGGMKYPARASKARRALVAIACALLSQGCISLRGGKKIESAPPLSLSEDVQRAADAVYRMTVYDRCGKNAPVVGGSAIVFGSSIITARHIFDMLQNDIPEGYPANCIIQEFVSFDGTDTLRVPLERTEFTFFKDAARVTIDSSLARGPERSPKCFMTNYEVGDSIYIVGYPGPIQASGDERQRVIVQNVIEQTQPSQLGDLIISSGMPPRKGMSGGAVIDRFGCVIGVWIGTAQPWGLKRKTLILSTPLTGIEVWFIKQ